MELSGCGDMEGIEGIWEGESWLESIVLMFFSKSYRKHLNTCRLENLMVNMLFKNLAFCHFCEYNFNKFLLCINHFLRVVINVNTKQEI